MKNNPHMMSYIELRDLLIDRKAKSVDITIKALSKIKESSLNSFITLSEELAIKSAEESDKSFMHGNIRPLEGMLIGVKDNISTKGIRTTCGSKLLKDFVPIYDATVIDRIKNAGGIILGKTNMDEFAMGSSNENSAFGPVSHPLNNDLVSGGSSGGSAVAVASGLVHAALGSDTGGSVRQPAAFTGVIGFKPTYGRISRYGLTAFASSLDQIGILTRNLKDAALIYEVISGKDELDSTTVSISPESLQKHYNVNIPKNIKVAVLSDEILKKCSDDILDNYYRCLEIIKNAGGEILQINFDTAKYWIPAYYILSTAEASSNLARFDGIRYGSRKSENEDMVVSRSKCFGDEVKRRIMLGTFVLSSGFHDDYYRKALKVRRLVQEDYRVLFSQADIFFLPVTPSPAFKKGEKTGDPLSMYFSDYFTISANLAGVPAISIPAGTTKEGLPIGMQVQSRHFSENMLFGYADFFLKLFNKPVK